MHLRDGWSPYRIAKHPGRPYIAHQDMAIALAMCHKLLGDRGAFRVHGGGFAGTVQAFVPMDMLDAFRSGIECDAAEGNDGALCIQ